MDNFRTVRATEVRDFDHKKWIFYISFFSCLTYLSLFQCAEPSYRHIQTSLASRPDIFQRHTLTVIVKNLCQEVYVLFHVNASHALLNAQDLIDICGHEWSCSSQTEERWNFQHLTSIQVHIRFFLQLHFNIILVTFNFCNLKDLDFGLTHKIFLLRHIQMLFNSVWDV